MTYGWITNTLELAHLKLSENLRDEIVRNPLLEIVGPAGRTGIRFARQSEQSESAVETMGPLRTSATLAARRYIDSFTADPAENLAEV